MNIWGNLERLGQLAQELERLNNKTVHLHDNMQTYKNTLDFDIGQIDEQISERIKKIVDELELISTAFKQHANYIWDVRHDYNKTENDIVNLIDEVGRTKTSGTQLSASSGKYECAINLLFPTNIKAGAVLPEIKFLDDTQMQTERIMDSETTVIEHWLEDNAHYNGY